MSHVRAHVTSAPTFLAGGSETSGRFESAGSAAYYHADPPAPCSAVLPPEVLIWARAALFFLITRHIRSHGRVLPNGATEVTCPPQFWLSHPSHHLRTPWSLAGWIQRTQGKPWAGEAIQLLKEGILEPSSGSDSHPSSHQPQGLSQEREREEERLKKIFFYEGTDF